MIHSKNVREFSSLIFLYTVIFTNFPFSLVFILRNFVAFSAILTKVAVGSKTCDCFYRNLREKLMVGTGFSNDESARPSTLLKLKTGVHHIHFY